MQRAWQFYAFLEELLHSHYTQQPAPTLATHSLVLQQNTATAALDDNVLTY
jgi:hypothetical protein